MDPALKTDANRVRGCVSQIWVHTAPEAEADAPGCVRFQADSDAHLTKGLASLLVLGLSGAPARDVAMVLVEFIEMFGIRQSLSPSRNSGLLNMVNLMKLKALQIAAGGDGAGEETAGSQEILHRRPDREEPPPPSTPRTAAHGSGHGELSVLQWMQESSIEVRFLQPRVNKGTIYDLPPTTHPA